MLGLKYDLPRAILARMTLHILVRDLTMSYFGKDAICVSDFLESTNLSIIMTNNVITILLLVSKCKE